jgi:hypothetical protein
MSTVAEQATRNFDPAELHALAEEQSDCFITMLLPTHRHSPDYKQDHIRLKNLIGNAEKLLSQRQQPKNLLDDAKGRIDNDLFWQHQLDGLAVLITADGTRYRQLDFPVDERLFIDEHPLLRPLVPRFDRVDQATVLTVTWESAQLFALRNGRVEAEEHEAFPIRFEQVSGVREADEQLHLHSQRQVGGPSDATASDAALYHGHGDGERYIEADRKKFLSAVASAFAKATYGSTAKAVIVGTEEVLGHFKSETKREDFVEVIGSPAEFKPDELSQRVRDTLQHCRTGHLNELRETFGQAVASGKGSTDLTELYRAVKRAQIDQLLLLDDREVWARISGDELSLLPENEVPADRQPDGDRTELINHLVIETLKQGGSVIRGDASDFELPDSTAAAVFRY